MRVVVIGDVGGHRNVLERSIRMLGGDPGTGALPADTIVAQVGDVVGLSATPGPDSGGCVEVIDRMLRANATAWVQIWGNHDLAVIGGPRREAWARKTLARETISTLRSWWQEGIVRRAFGFVGTNGQALITHAGLTVGYWEKLGKPDCRVAVRRLNDEARSMAPEDIRAGALVTGTSAAMVDVAWSEVVHELYEPWYALGHSDRPVPFSQIHGHAAIWNWETGDFWPGTPSDLINACRVDPLLRRTTTEVGHESNGARALMIAVDWNLRDVEPPALWPLAAFDADEVWF